MIRRFRKIFRGGTGKTSSSSREVTPEPNRPYLIEQAFIKQVPAKNIK
ncbi:unnamed protein product, partial [Didymodactylos carnosus]